jgi:hypothetical protein
MARSLLDLPLKARAVFFFAYLGVQGAVLVHAQRSPDFVFGFFRRVHQRGHSRLIPVRDGAWRAKDAHGMAHDFRWADRVHDGVLGTLGSYVHASYGLAAQTFRLQLALRDVLAHISDDHETEALIAVVDTIKNGREYGQLQLQADRP